MKKELFEKVVIDIVEINSTDIITTSNEDYIPSDKDEGFGPWV